MAVHTHKESAVERKDRLKWEAESDLRSLREVEDIKKDKSRLGRAQKLAQKEMRALKKVSASKPRKAPARKTTSRKRSARKR